MQNIEPVCAGASLTVIIPSYNRCALLIRTLAALERQTVSGFRVIVVDDGSSDDTPAAVAGFMARSALSVEFRRQHNAGPARARNVGLSLVRTPLVAMIGDDTLPEPGFVAAHLAFHAAHPDLRDAAIGHTRWCEESQTVTPFMRWLDMEGVQFGYRALLAGDAPDWRHFYTSNVSAKMALLGPQPFDEGFAGAAMEDIEAGYRLTVEQGMRIAFLRDAVVRHVHPMTFVGACRRAMMVGANKHRFCTLWPETRGRPRGVMKQAIVDLLSRPASLRLARLAGRVAAHRGGGRLTMMVIRLHEGAGWRSAAASADAAGMAPQPLFDRAAPPLDAAA